MENGQLCEQEVAVASQVSTTSKHEEAQRVHGQICVSLHSCSLEREENIQLC